MWRSALAIMAVGMCALYLILIQFWPRGEECVVCALPLPEGSESNICQTCNKANGGLKGEE